MTAVGREEMDKIQCCSPFVVRLPPPDNGMGTTLKVSTRPSSLVHFTFPFDVIDSPGGGGCGCNGGA